MRVNYSIQTSHARSEKDSMEARDYIKNACGRFVTNQNTMVALLKTKHQETGKEYSTMVQMIVEDDRGKAIA